MGGHLFERLSLGVGSGPEVTLRIRIFRLLTATTAFLCLVLVMPTNLLQNLDIKVHVANVLLGLVSGLVYWQSRRGRHYITAFLLAVVLMLDAVWFWNGGSQGTITFFYFPVLLYVVAMQRGRTQILATIALMANVIGLFVVEAYRPEWVTPFASVADRRLDLGIGIICGFTAVAVIASVILSSHDREQQRISQIATQLTTSEQNYRETFNSTSDALFVHDEKGGVVDVNERAQTIFGATRDQLMKGTFTDFSLGQSPYSLLEATQKISLAMQGQPQVFVWRSRKVDGTAFWSEVALRVGRIGGTQRVIAAVRDITERKQAEEAMRRSEERLRLCLVASAQGWFEINVQTGLGESSPEYVRMIGHDPATYQTTLEGWISGIHPEDREKLIKAYRECVTAGDTRTMEYRRQTKSGVWKWIRSMGSIIEYDADGKPLRMYGTHADITERKELEAQLLHSQRLEAVGTLASGVAHDLNNILTPMLMATGILRESLSDPRDRELMAMLDSGGKRGAAIVKQLLDFSRNLTRDRVALDPAQVLRETAQWMRSSLPPSIEVKVVATEGLPGIEADPTQLHQVMMNLCVNARDAMPTGGVLTLVAEVAEASTSSHPTEHGLPSRRHVIFKVVDTGCGIAPEVRDRIFDPFFTTKGPGKGTGLGLASVHGIVKAHDGFVRVESSPGQGSTFAVYLPAMSGPAPARNPEAGVTPATPAKDASTQFCVLVVDDDDSVRLVTRRRLELEGYRVLVANGGAEALALLRDPAQPVDVVVTDFAMPGMDGPTLAPRLRQLRPTLPIIGMSGNDQRGRAAELTALGFAEVLSKPYAASDLLAALRRHLPSRPRG